LGNGARFVRDGRNGVLGDARSKQSVEVEMSYFGSETGLPCVTVGASDGDVYGYSGQMGIISAIQTQLAEYYGGRSLGHLPEPFVTGILSNDDVELVKLYQNEFGLGVDGIIGKQTYAQMGISGNYLPCGKHTVYWEPTSMSAAMGVNPEKKRRTRNLVLAGVAVAAAYWVHKNREYLLETAGVKFFTLVQQGKDFVWVRK
jgi:hypothetical protein